MISDNNFITREVILSTTFRHLVAKQMRPSALMTGFHCGQGKKRALLTLVQASSSDGFFFALLKKFFLSLDARLNAVATIEKIAYAEPPHPTHLPPFIFPTRTFS